MARGPCGVLAEEKAPCMSSTRSSLHEYSYVQWEKASSNSSSVQQGVISSPVLLLYFRKWPCMFLSIVSHWPFEFQWTSDTSRNLMEGRVRQWADNNAGQDAERKAGNTLVSGTNHPAWPGWRLASFSGLLSAAGCPAGIKNRGWSNTQAWS